MSPVRAVICDFGGVLTTPLIDAFLAYQDHSGVAFEDLGRALREIEGETGKHPLYELEKGNMTEPDFIAALERHLGVQLERFRETYFDHLAPNEPMIALMRELRAEGFRMALLTNNVREWEPLWRAKLPDVDEIFELVVDSAFVGMRKPEPGIYELTLERLDGGLTFPECVFVDDNELNCQAARELGMTAVQFTRNEQTIPAVRAAVGER